MSNPLLELMAQGESGTAGYNAYNRGTYVDAHGGKHIRGPAGAIDFSTLTVGQVHDRQHLRGDDQNRLFAVGKYQIIPATMNDAIDKLQLDRSQPFTPAVQDRIFSDYLISDKRPEIKNYIAGKPGSTLENAQSSLAAEWASFGDPANGGRSHYPPPNVASITLKQSAEALNYMRAQYQADIAKGMLPDAAWDFVTNSEPSHTKAPTAQHTPAHSHGVLKQGDHGNSVRTLQQNLNNLGYIDGLGHPLKADGHFGINTRHAVERFQHDHHLTVDGIAGPKTLAALHAQTQTSAKALPGLDDPRNPDYELYEQALAGVRKLDAQAGRPSDQHSANLAAAPVVAAKKEGITRIDDVALSSDNGASVFAVQHSAVPKYAQVPTLPSLNTPIEQNSRTAQQVNPPQTPPPMQTPSAPTQNAPSLSL